MRVDKLLITKRGRYQLTYQTNTDFAGYSQGGYYHFVNVPRLDYILYLASQVYLNLD